MENRNNSLYDELAQDCGEVVKENEIKTTEGDEVVEKINKSMNEFAYGGAELAPGESLDGFFSEMTSVDEDKAVNKMLSEAAILKMKKEQEAEKRVLTKEQRMAQKKEVCEYLMYQQEEAYFKQNHFIMDGKTKRRVRKMIERNYDKGRYGSANGSSLNG